MGVGERALEEVVRHFDAIHLRQDPVAINAADVIAAGARTLAGPAHGHARLVAYQVANAVDVATIQRRSVLHGHRAGYRTHRLRLTCGADCDLLQFQRAGLLGGSDGGTVHRGR